MKNKPVLILAGILVIALIVMGYKWGSSQASNKAIRAEMKNIEEVAQGEIDVLNEENNQLEARAIAAEGVAEAVLEENDGLKDKLQDSEEKMDELRDKLQEAKPKTLLAETRRIVGTNEIWYNEEAQTFTFSLAAFRKQTIINSEWENFMLVEKPNYQEQIENFEIAVINYQFEISDLKLMNLNWQNKFTVLEGAFGDYKKAVGKIKKPGFFDTVLKVGLGFAAAKFFDVLSGNK